MSSTQPPHHHHQSQSLLQPDSSSSHSIHSYGGVGSSSSSNNASKTTPGPLAHLQLFADERRDAIALPKIETDAHSINSSPYTSPHLAPRGRVGAIGNMEEVTLPPIQAAVPMRRGAVSGASSGPSLPFPPIRLSYEEEVDIPSRGPSPTLGKRGSFSMGHSNHVPPGPDIQLPTPVLSGSGERRPIIAPPVPSYVTSHSLYHGDGPSSDIPRSGGGGMRLSEDSHGHYTPSSHRSTTMPWSQYKTNPPKSEVIEAAPPPYHAYHTSPPITASTVPTHRPGQFNDEQYHRHYSPARLPPHHQSQAHHHPYSSSSQPRSSSSGYRYDYNREESAMSPGSNHSVVQGDSSLSPRTNQSHLMHDDPHGVHDVDAMMNSKRPRSAPRVMSSQPRIFACQQCPARFARNHDLKRHQRGHLSVRPYPCNFCGKSFSRKDALKRHILVKGCGKNSKGGGGGGGKGEGKGKHSRGDDGKKRSHRAGSSGDQEEENYGEEEEEQDDGASEENQDKKGDHASSHRHHHHQRWDQDQKSQSQQRQNDNRPYYPMKEEYRDKYKDTVMQIGNSSYSNAASHSGMPTAFHRRPSASVA